jgi:dTDP-4-amino-4,6-dideoxygalactose transaminase
MSYNAWPLGQIPKENQRPELDILKEKGYPIKDPRDAIDLFEETIAKFAGCKYAVSVDCCTHGLFLCMKYLNASGTITVPSKTYTSVPMYVLHAGCQLKFEDKPWFSKYQLKPYPIWDCALQFSEGMYEKDFEVLSFQIKKTLPIGRGGMILTNDEKAYRWFKKACYDGRDLKAKYDKDDFEVLGYHFYMTPEDAARGLLLFEGVSKINEPCIKDPYNHYSDLTTKTIFN